MKMNHNKTNNPEPGQILRNFTSAIETKEGTFYNLCNNLFKEIEKLGDIKSPIVTMTCTKKFLSYKFSFDIVYINADGKPYRSKEFFSDSLLGGMVGVIPRYIVDAVKQNGSAEICFNANDLELLFNELNEDIIESKEWNDLENECIANSCASVKLFDRVFYTRVECYDVNNQQMGLMHIAILNGLSTTISSKLYPVGQAEHIF